MKTPERDEFLPFARPSITDREKQAVLEVLDSGWLTTGPRTKAFEAQFAGRVGASHAVALNSCTAALHLALEALGVGPDDEVIVPTWTFAASAEVVAYLGARPVLVDVDARTLNASPDTIMAAVTPRTKAVIVVHFGGLPVEIETITRLLDARGIPVVEDAAHAFPSRIGGPTGRYAGTFGRAGAYSFYATKTITTAEGGMLVTDDDAVAARARIMGLHGISSDAWKRYGASGSWYYEIQEAGYKYNLTDIAAALGLIQLERADELLQTRRTLAAAYTQQLGAAASADLLELPADAADGSHAWHLYVVRLHLDRLSIDSRRGHREPQGGGHRDERPLHPASSPPVLPGTLGVHARRAADGVPGVRAGRVASAVARHDPGGCPARHRVGRRRAQCGAARLAGSAQGGGGPGPELKIEERRPAVEVLGVEAKLRGQDLVPIALLGVRAAEEAGLVPVRERSRMRNSRA